MTEDLESNQNLIKICEHCGFYTSFNGSIDPEIFKYCPKCGTPLTWQKLMDKREIKEIVNMVRKKLDRKILLPEKSESVAITDGKNKTASLCYDRIWGPERLETHDEFIPESIRFFADTEAERQIYVFEKHGRSVIDWLTKQRGTITKSNTQELIEEVPRPKAIQCLKLLRDFCDYLRNVRDKKDEETKFILRRIARSFSKKYSVPVVTIYESEKDRAREYIAGNAQVIIASLSELNIVDESKLIWEQVLEFRKDKETRNKYKRFLHWLDKEMIGKTQSFIEDEIAIRLEDYKQALKKHGIKTTIGIIQETLDGKFLLGASGITGTLTLAGHPTFGLLAGAGIVVGRVAIKLTQTAIDLDDLECGSNSEISWVYEVKKLSE